MLEERAEDANAYERRDALIFSGDGVPTATIGENCTSILCKLIKDKLKLNIQQSDISTSHRLGRKSIAQGQDRRNLVMKFCRRDF